MQNRGELVRRPGAVADCADDERTIRTSSPGGHSQARGSTSASRVPAPAGSEKRPVEHRQDLVVVADDGAVVHYEGGMLCCRLSLPRRGGETRHDYELMLYEARRERHEAARHRSPTFEPPG